MAQANESEKSVYKGGTGSSRVSTQEFEAQVKAAEEAFDTKRMQRTPEEKGMVAVYAGGAQPTWKNRDSV